MDSLQHQRPKSLIRDIIMRNCPVEATCQVQPEAKLLQWMQLGREVIGPADHAAASSRKQECVWKAVSPILGCSIRIELFLKSMLKKPHPLVFLVLPRGHLLLQRLLGVAQRGARPLQRIDAVRLEPLPVRVRLVGAGRRRQGRRCLGAAQGSLRHGV